MKRVKALQTAAQNFLIGYAFLRPTFKHTINSDALGALEFVIIEIGVVDHFAHLVNDFVLNSESFEQCLEGAVFSVMREFSAEHVERHRATIRRNLRRENNLRFGIDEFPDQPGGADAIDLGAWTRDPGSAVVISRRNFWNRHLAWLRSSQFAQKHFHILGTRAVEEVGLPDLAKLFSDAVEFVAKCRLAPFVATMTQSPKQLAECRVLLRSRGIE